MLNKLFILYLMDVNFHDTFKKNPYKLVKGNFYFSFHKKFIAFTEDNRIRMTKELHYKKKVIEYIYIAVQINNCFTLEVLICRRELYIIIFLLIYLRNDHLHTLNSNEHLNLDKVKPYTIMHAPKLICNKT
jgi:hypothetical protein